MLSAQPSSVAFAWGHPKSVDLGITTGVLLLLLWLSLATTNPLETVWSLLLLWISVKMFWWQGYPPILVYALLMPWLEVHFNAFEANFYRVSLDDLFPSGTGRKTFWIASTGYLAILVGLHLGLKSIQHRIQPVQEFLRSEALRINQLRIVQALIAFRLFEVLLSRGIPWGSSLRQLVTYFGGIGLSLSLLLALHFFLTKKRPWLFFSVFVFDLITSFYSYFGSWKGPFIILIIGAAISIRTITLRQVVIYSPLLIGVLFFTFVWQAIKPEYRAFLSQNERGQVIRVNQSDALRKFVDLSGEAIQMNEFERQVVFGDTFRRIGYLEYYSDAVNKVPDRIPHERGNLLLENLSFVLIPRVLNYDKGVKNDRLKVEKYTSYNFGANSFSSFSLGHYCEAYIDWGWGGSLLHLFLYGLLGAFLVKATYHRFNTLNAILMLSILFCVINPWGTMQQDFITMFGRVTWNSICQLFIFFPIYIWLDRFLSNETTSIKATRTS